MSKTLSIQPGSSSSYNQSQAVPTRCGRWEILNKSGVTITVNGMPIENNGTDCGRFEPGYEYTDDLDIQFGSGTVTGLVYMRRWIFSKPENQRC